MAKEFAISPGELNSYGFRVLPSGIDITQYLKNPVLLYMHRRGFDGESMPIGTVKNLRFDGDRLIGEPEFDMDDPFAEKIAKKWEKGVLRMVSPGLDPKEWSTAAEHLLPGQTHATATKSKMIEISIADIGSNDGSLQLYKEGKLIQLSSGADSGFVPLLSSAPEADPLPDPTKTTTPNNNDMKEILLALGLPETATEAEAVAAINTMKSATEKIELSRIETAVDGAIHQKKVTADKRDQLITLGKTAGFENLQITLSMLTPVQKLTDLIHPSTTGGTSSDKKFVELSATELETLRTNNKPEYIRLYQAEFGFPPEL